MRLVLLERMQPALDATKVPEIPMPVLVISGNPFLETNFGVHLDYTTQVSSGTLALANLVNVNLFCVQH